MCSSDLNECLGATMGTFLAGGGGAVGQVFLQGTLHAVFPRIDARVTCPFGTSSIPVTN